MNYKYVNIRSIMDSLLRHPLLNDLSFESVIDYTVDFIRIVGVPVFFDDKVVELSIEEYRAELPSDFSSIIQMKDKQSNLPYRATNDTFHLSENKRNNTDLTYKIQGNIIYTSNSSGDIELAYKSIPVDEYGLPMIPDNSSFSRALELYIKKQWFTILFDLEKISHNTLSVVQQDYAWAVGDCQSEFNRLSLDEMESISNQINTLIPNSNQHRIGFSTLGSREKLRF